MFPKIVVPQNRWFIRENPIKMDDLRVPLFLETAIYIHVLVCMKCISKDKEYYRLISGVELGGKSAYFR